MWARPRSPVERIGGVSRPAASRIQTALASGSPTAQAGYTHGFCGENAAPSAIDLALPVWISRHGNVLPRSDPGVQPGYCPRGHCRISLTVTDFAFCRRLSG